MLTITVKPRPCGIRFDAFLNEHLVYTGRQPHFGAARSLIRSGHGPETSITTTTSSGTPVFRSMLGRLAALSVEDRADGRVCARLVKYRAPPSIRLEC